ncbi:MAG: transglutaminase-like domain-containing protein [Bianqueaceae bacterium]
MKRMVKWMLIWSSYFLLSWLGSAGSIVSFGSALSIPADYPAITYGCAAVSAVMAALYGIPRKGIRWIFAGTSAVLLAFCLYAVRQDLIRGAAYVGSLVSIEYSKEIEGIEYLVPLENLPQGQIRDVITIFFAGCGALLSWFLAWAVARKYRSYLGVVLTLPFLAAVLVITREPNWAGILFLFPFWAALILSGRRQGKDEVDRAKLVLLALPVSAALSAVLFFTLGRDTYSRPDAVDHLRLRIMGELAEGDSSVAPGGTRPASQDIDLQGRGDLRFTGEVVLMFSRNPGRLYLRGRSGARYTGSAWTAFADEVYEGMDFSMYPMNIAPQFFGWYPTNLIVIEPRHLAADFVLTPYNLDMEDMPALVPVRDLYYESKDSGPYTFTYMDMMGEPLYDFDMELEEGFQAYDQFVMDQYLQVPEELRTRLETLVDNDILRGWGVVESESDLIQQVVSFLSSYQYTLTPGAVPPGEDFVEYFLFQSQQGYCVHFASAATLLLRTLGIPARYAEGYAVAAEDFGGDGWAQVRDRRGHAWVEVYYRGLGWQPLEVTPGGMEAADQVLEVESSAPAESSGESSVPAESSLEVSEPREDSSSSEPAVERPQSGVRSNFWPLWACIVLLALGMCAILRRRWRAAMRRREFYESERNQAVVSMYGYLVQLRPYGAVVSAEIKELALKAKYSQQGVTEEEAQTMRRYTQEQVIQVKNSLPFWRRMVFCYVRALG